MGSAKRIIDVLSGNLVGFAENIVSFIVSAQIIKDRSRNENSAVTNDELAICISIAFMLYMLDCLSNYYLLPKQNNNELDIEANTNAPLIAQQPHPDLQKAAVTMYMTLGGMSQALLDFAGLASALYGLWKNPEGNEKIAYFACLATFLFIGSAHGFVEGAGTRGQAMRKAKMLPIGEVKLPNDHPKFSRFLDMTTIVAPGFMTFSYYGGGVNSFINLMKFYSCTSNMAIYGIASVLGLVLVLPNLLMDYLVMISKLLYTYSTFGYVKQHELNGKKTPLATALTWLHDKTYLRLYRQCINANEADLYALSLWNGKMFTRILMLSGFFYNLMQVISGNKEAICAKDYSPAISLVLVVVSILAAFSAHLEFRSFGLAPIQQIEQRTNAQQPAEESLSQNRVAVFARRLHNYLRKTANEDVLCMSKEQSHEALF